MSNEDTKICEGCGERITDNWSERLEDGREFEDVDEGLQPIDAEQIDEDELVTELEGSAE